MICHAPRVSRVSDDPRLLLIDGHSMAFRAFFALPADNFRTASGLYTNAVHGFLSMLLSLIENEKPTHLAVAFDTSAPTFRKEEYDAYKDGRDATPQEFEGQVAMIAQVLEAMNVPVVVKDGIEADDLLATLAHTGEAAGADVGVVSGDRDTFQLVDDKVTVLYPVKGVSDLRRMTPQVVEEKYGVPPHLHPHLTALVGEKSDNLPGVPGVGPKTAAKWIAQYGDLDGILAHAEEIKGKAGENLRAHRSDVERNRRLNLLLTDTEVPGVSDAGDPTAQLERLALAAVDREAVNQIFDTLEFRTLRTRLFALLPSEGDVPAGAAPTVELEVSSPATLEGGLGAWLGARRAGEGAVAGATRTGLAVEVTGGLARGDIDADAIALATGDGHGVWIDLAALDEEQERALAAWLADPAAPKVAHDAKTAWHALRARGLTLAGVTVDTEIAAYLTLPDQRQYDVRDLVERFVGRSMLTLDAPEGELDLAGLTEDVGGTGARIPAAGRLLVDRADALVVLARALEDQLVAREQAGLLHDLEMPVQRVLTGMEDVGIGVRPHYLADLEAEFDERVRAAQQAAFDAIGHEVNLSSPKQLQSVLFDELDMPRTKKTKTGYTTDADALQELYRKATGATQRSFLEHLLAHRDAIKLRQIVETLRKFVQDDARIHTTFKQTVAATGRLASADPNLQNIPQRTEEGRRIRQGFVVSDGYDMLMTADYSQVEMRIMAHLSQDEGLIEAFRSGEDLHRFVASRVFHIPLEEVSSDDRSRVKAISYGLAYGLSAYGLSRSLVIPVDEAQGLMDGYFDRFGGVRDYLTGVVEQATKDGYTSTIMGRRRYLPDLTSSNRQRRENAKRVALNAPIQGSAADLIKIAMVDLARELAERDLRSRLLLQVHDELVLEVVEPERAEVEALVRAAMAGAATLSVPLDVSVGVGQTWFDAAH